MHTKLPYNPSQNRKWSSYIDYFSVREVLWLQDWHLLQLHFLFSAVKVVFNEPVPSFSQQMYSCLLKELQYFLNTPSLMKWKWLKCLTNWTKLKCTFSKQYMFFYTSNNTFCLFAHSQRDKNKHCAWECEWNETLSQSNDPLFPYKCPGKINLFPFKAENIDPLGMSY